MLSEKIPLPFLLVLQPPKNSEIESSIFESMYDDSVFNKSQPTLNRNSGIFGSP